MRYRAYVIQLGDNIKMINITWKLVDGRRFNMENWNYYKTVPSFLVETNLLS